ncbi:hypothetical protein [Paenibacillus protaetiae]|uniref:Uncharacterized protein n=1 Tax=Paenibacillus protaetiae TaxID=2509456 RepID=A0A4P6EY26_9BACL|nr:hypothetical protein [Paenibacillus protaetiae]QAY67153.1 hypothetical protein ET464_12850 [Paenibacillus protaetiae]
MIQPLWYTKALALTGQPVGVSLANGQGVTGVLCSLTGGEAVLIEYMYQSQFAAKHYPFSSIQDINPFPGCTVPGPLF